MTSPAKRSKPSSAETSTANPLFPAVGTRPLPHLRVGERPCLTRPITFRTNFGTPHQIVQIFPERPIRSCRFLVEPFLPTDRIAQSCQRPAAVLLPRFRQSPLRTDDLSMRSAGAVESP